MTGLRYVNGQCKGTCRYSIVHLLALRYFVKFYILYIFLYFLYFSNSKYP